jgi:hypothetical protein
MIGNYRSADRAGNSQGTYPTLFSSWMTEEKDVNQQKIGRGN